MPDQKPPLFSIITVTRNNLDGLKRTQESIEKQTRQDFEWIVIDGASADGTPDYLAALPSKPFPVKTLSEPDSGLYEAMNKGIKRASGDYLLFLNAGDCLAAQQTLEKIEIATAKNPDFIYGDALEPSKNAKPFYKKSRPAQKLIWGMFTHHQSMFYRRKLVRAHKLLFRQIYDIAADYEFTARVLRHAERKIYIGLPICLFEPGGVSQQNALEGRRQQYIIRETLELVPQPLNLAIFIIQSVTWELHRRFPGLYRFLKSPPR